MELVKKLVAEWIGTFSLVLFGCGSICWFQATDTPFSLLTVSFIFGVTIFLMISCFAKVSGAHFNPVVSFAFYRKNKINTLEFILFTATQCFASFIACIALSSLFPETKTFGATLPQIDLTSTLLIEAVLSFTLVFVILIVALFTHFKPLAAGLVIGGTVGLCSFLGGHFTGASMNPARSLGPNIFEGQTDVLWIYFFAPLAGALLAVGAYNLFFHGGKNYEKNSLPLRR